MFKTVCAFPVPFPNDSGSVGLQANVLLLESKAFRFKCWYQGKGGLFRLWPSVSAVLMDVEQLLHLGHCIDRSLGQADVLA